MKRLNPGIVAHADWSVDPAKRWLCIATREGPSFTLGPPVPVGDVADLPERLVAQSPDRSVLLGVDFPLGLPLAYARRAGIDSFVDFLDIAGRGAWAGFYKLCGTAEEIELRRPFYPARSGGTRQAHLCEGLGVSTIDELRRRCELKTDDRKAAAPLFWTLGGQQVGRAAISGWRELLVPARRATRPAIRLWPFEGGLANLIAADSVVLAEAYPAESATHLGIRAPGRGWSKRRQTDRAAHAITLTRWAFRRRVTISDALLPPLRDGFGDLGTGEDQFDAVIGTAGMLETILGRRPEMPPMSNERRIIEGWILGQR